MRHPQAFPTTPTVHIDGVDISTVTADDFFVYDDEPPRVPWRERLARAWAALLGRPEPMTSEDTLRREVLDWQAQTFRSRTLASITAHLSREAVELLNAPDDPSEYADALMLLWAAFDELDRLIAEHDIAALDAVRAKLARNRLRVWGEPDEQGVVSHIAEGDSRMARGVLALMDELDDDDGCPVNDPSCEGGDGDCHDACEAPVSPEVTRDLLLISGHLELHDRSIDQRFVLSVCAAWTQEQRESAAEWAGAVHLRASDNDVDVPELPEHVRALLQAHAITCRDCTTRAGCRLAGRCQATPHTPACVWWDVFANPDGDCNCGAVAARRS